MKKRTFSLLTIVLGILLCAFSPHVKHNIQATSLRALLNQISTKWNLWYEQTDLSYEAIDSWLPDRGVRGRYAVAKQVMSKTVIETLVGEQVFLGGPHMSEMDFAHGNFGQSFSHSYAGRYNPAFLAKLHEILESTLEDELFVFDFQSFYNKQLKRYLRTFYLAYHARTNKQMEQVFQEQIQTNVLDFYEAPTCEAFWSRRTKNGTDDEFYELLILMMETFDPTYLRTFPDIQEPATSTPAIQAQVDTTQLVAMYQQNIDQLQSNSPIYESISRSEEGGGYESKETVYRDDEGLSKLVLSRAESDGYLHQTEYYYHDGKLASYYNHEVRPHSHVDPHFTASQERLYFDAQGNIIKARTKSLEGKFGEDDPHMSHISSVKPENPEDFSSIKGANRTADEEFSDLMSSMIQTFNANSLKVNTGSKQSDALSPQHQSRLQEIRNLYQEYTEIMGYITYEVSYRGEGGKKAGLSVAIDDVDYDYGKELVRIDQSSENQSFSLEFYFQNNRLFFFYADITSSVNQTDSSYTLSQLRLYVDQQGNIFKALIKLAEGVEEGNYPEMDELPNQEVYLTPRFESQFSDILKSFQGRRD